MNFQVTPPLGLSTIGDTEQFWQWIEGQTPVDFTAIIDGLGWSAEFLIETRDGVIHRSPVALDASGYLSVTVPVLVALALRSCRRIDANYQITITAPLPDMSEVWRGPVVVHEATQ